MSVSVRTENVVSLNDEPCTLVKNGTAALPDKDKSVFLKSYGLGGVSLARMKYRIVGAEGEATETV